MVQAFEVKLASRNYDGVQPIVRQDVAIPGVGLQVTLDNDTPRLFKRLFDGEVDAGEMSLAELVYYTSRGKADFVGIPVFPSRVFRHAFLFATSALGPEGMNGRKIGFQRWVQTAGVWMRGMLTDTYGVSPRETPWYVMSTHHWEDAHEDDVQPRDGSEIRRYATPPRPGADLACDALLAGEIDVVGITETQAPALLAAGSKRVFADYRAAEADYYRRTGIFPIMHVLAISRQIVEAQPELPQQLFRLFAESKRQAQLALAAVPSWSFAWKDGHLEQEQAFFGRDPWAFGLEANRHVLDTFLRYCWEQGISARQIAPEDLFAASTLALKDA